MCKNKFCLNPTMPHHNIKAFAWTRVKPGPNNFFGTGNDMLGIYGTKWVKWIGDARLDSLPLRVVNTLDQCMVINEKTMQEFIFNIVHSDRDCYYLIDSHTQTMVLRLAK